MPYLHLEATPLERDDVVRLVELVDLGADPLRQVQVVRRQLVLGVAPTADVALAARNASGPPRPHAPEVGIVGLHARLPEVHAHRSLVEGLSPARLVRDLVHDPVDVGGQVRVADDAEHAPRLVDVRRQLVGPVRDARPLRRVEELLGRHVQRVGVDVRPTADTGTAEHEDVVQVLDPLDPVQLSRREPEETRQVPLALRQIVVAPPFAGLHDTDAVALLGSTERGHAPAEPRSDDHDVIVEARHAVDRERPQHPPRQ